MRRAAKLVLLALAFVAILEDTEVRVQFAARFAMHKLEPAAGHMDAVVARLEDSGWGVREAAVQTLGMLDAAALAPHEQALDKAASDDEDDDVRVAAAELLARLRAGN